MNKRVVITGRGIWSCLGTNLQSVTDALRAGKSGVIFDQARCDYGYHSGLVGNVPPVVLTKNDLDRHTRAGMGEPAQYAFKAAQQAFVEAGITSEYIAQNEIGCIFGNDSTAKSVIDTVRTMEEQRDTAMLGFGAVFQNMNSTVSMNLSTIFHLRGVSFSVSAACASSSHSIGLAYTLIRDGQQDVILCGGAQETNLYSTISFDALGAFSKKHDNPAEASRPFDKSRDGLVPSGGAAALVLEEYEHALARGANIICEVVGYGFSSSGQGISQPSADACFVCMKRALDNAGIMPAEVDYVNAHATSTPLGDALEAQALTQLFAVSPAWISSTKSMTGHECWMAGASEVVYSSLMMQHGFVAPNINLADPAPEATTLRLARETIQMPIKTVLSNSFGFGGTNSALVLRQI